MANQRHYDFVIIGGGPTGSTAAFYLCKKGHSVLVLEREKFPRQHVGESLLPFCYPLFVELGVMDEMRRRFVRKPGARFSKHDGSMSSTWCFGNVIHDESALSFHVVRADFDKMLLDNARRNGAEVHEESKVESVDLNRADGIVEVQTIEANQLVSYTAKFLIDATGQDTFLARRLGDKTAYKDLDRIAFLTHWRDAEYAEGISSGLLQLVYLEDYKSGWFGIQPVGKNRISVGLVINRSYLKQQKEILRKAGYEKDWQMQFYLQEIQSCKLTREILAHATIAQPLIAVSDFSYFAEKTFDHNFAMLGDAGKFLDPIFASGVYLGMNSAKLFSEALDILIREGREAGMEAMTRHKKKIDGAYSLVEKFINIFYAPDSFNLAEVSSLSESGYSGYESAFAMFHYLLAGDFFNRYEEYSDFLDMLRNPRQYARWKNLVISRPHPLEKTCNSSWEMIFGEIDDELTRNTSINGEKMF